MKRKSKYLLCLIGMIVLSSVLLSLGSSVSAYEINNNGYLILEEGWNTLKGDDLLRFLTTNFQVSVGVSDTFNDASGAYWLDPNDYDYQFVCDTVGDNVYMTFSFPKKDGVSPTIRGEYYIIRFWCNQPAYEISGFKTNIYKRYHGGNGDEVTDGDSQPVMSFTIGSDGVNANGTSFTVQTDDTSRYVDYMYPLLNQGPLDLGYMVINPWITSYRSTFETYSACPIYVDYNTSRDSGLLSEPLLSLQLSLTSGNTYNTGAVMFAVEPIEIYVTRSFEDMLVNPSDKDREDYLAAKDEFEKSKNIFEDFSSTLSGYNEFVNSNEIKPDINMNYLINLSNIGLLNSGISSFVTGSAPLFRDSAFFNIFFIIAAPPIIISYVLFGKKG